MNNRSDSYKVHCDVIITEPSGEKPVGDETPIGLLYDAKVNTNDKHIWAKIALSEYGTHQGILQRLMDSKRIPQASSEIAQLMPVHDTMGTSRNYIIGSELRDNEPLVWCLSGEKHDDKEIQAGAELVARAIAMTTGSFRTITEGQTIVWSEEELMTLPDDQLIIER